MKLEIDLNVRVGESSVITEILDRLKSIYKQGEKAMSVLDDLKAKVSANTTVIESAITLLQGLKAKLDEAIASGDPAALQALSDELGTEGTKLADAIVANTPTP